MNIVAGGIQDLKDRWWELSFGWAQTSSRTALFPALSVPMRRREERTSSRFHSLPNSGATRMGGSKGEDM